MAAAKRLKVEKEDRKNMLPPKSVGYQIKDTQPMQTLTFEEATRELHLTNGNIRLKKLEVKSLYERRYELLEILRPVIDDPQIDTQ